VSNALDGVLVVSLEQAVAAPLATSRLADAGARVIKLERPEGDFARGYDAYAKSHSSYFVWLNRNKQSCRVDLREPEDMALVRAMLARADVFVQNLGPGATDRLGIGAATLRKAFPRITTCDIAGFSPDTPHAERKGYDLLIQAEAGLSELTGTAESGPSRIGISICDILTGMTAHAQILEALYKRTITGQGSAISLSLFDVAMEAMNVPYIAAANGGPFAKRVGLAHPSIAPYGGFAVADGNILIAVQNDREWIAFADKVLGRPELGRDPRFATNNARVLNRGEMESIISSIVGGMTKSQALAQLDEARVAWGQISTLKDLLAHDGARRTSCSQEGTAIELIAGPAVVDGERRGSGEAPALGQHDESLRAEFAAS
jgi:crotonobetainyl-CoA:carnitine CoA-transferase CaiB-like acyl-CoA transferase